MVAESIAGLERSISDHTCTGFDHNNGQLKKTGGSNLQWDHHHPRIVESSGTIRPHQCPRAESSNVCNKSIHKGQKTASCPLENGQQNGHGSTKQNRGTQSHMLFQITHELWTYCLSREIIVTVEYLPGNLNEIADKESRVYLDRTNWMLKSTVIKQIENIWGTRELDMFADRLTAQKQRYVSWKPDHNALATDVFSIIWTQLSTNAFPPFCLIGRYLAKVKKDQAKIILIDQRGRRTAMFSHNSGNGDESTNLATTNIRSAIFTARETSPTHTEQQPHTSGVVCVRRLLQTQGVYQVQKLLTQAPGIHGVADVVETKLIHFRPMWVK